MLTGVEEREEECANGRIGEVRAIERADLLGGSVADIKELGGAHGCRDATCGAAGEAAVIEDEPPLYGRWKVRAEMRESGVARR